MSLLDERNRWLRVSLFSAGMGLIFGSLRGWRS